MQKKLNILKNAFGNPLKNRDEFLFQCPKCKHHKKKLSVNITKNVFKCWICDFTGSDIRYLFKKTSINFLHQWNQASGMVDLSKYDNLFDGSEDDTITEKVFLPKSFKSLTGQESSLNRRALKYLKSRGIEKKDILYWKMGFCDFGEYAGRIIIPSFNDSGDVNYFIARSYTGNKYKYKNPKISKDVIFNDLNINWNDDIILVEGVFDAIKCNNAIPVLGSTLTESSKLFQKICKKKPRVFICFDSDALEKQYQVSKKLMKYGVDVYKINIDGFLDMGEMSKEEVENRKVKADFVSELDYLKYKLNF